jgi:hypothetical protein
MPASVIWVVSVQPPSEIFYTLLFPEHIIVLYARPSYRVFRFTLRRSILKL